MHFLTDYGLFLAKIATLVISLLILVGGIITIASKDKFKHKLTIKKLNEKYQETADELSHALLSKTEYKKLQKDRKKTEKDKAKQKEQRKRIFVLDFNGDIKASAVSSLREEINAILTIANSQDEVVVKIESPGGMVHSYGLAASQLQRIKQKQIPLTVIIDKIAASGGYLMACVADRILAAPFAIVGSVGVVAQLPNFNRLLKKNNIDFEQHTAGEYKRTITLFGENTEQGRRKFQQELEDVHRLFKAFIQQHRNQVDIAKIATGEHWLAANALELKLVDDLITSDDYLMQASQQADIYEISYQVKRSLSEKLWQKVEAVVHSKAIY
jgi:serine protease SohB